MKIEFKSDFRSINYKHEMQIAAPIEQNFSYTSAAAEQGRGERSSPTHGIPQYTPGPGTHATDEGIKSDVNMLRQKGFG